MNTGEWSEYQWLQVGAGYGRLQQQQPALRLALVREVR
jgi:hypothetical protein